MIFKSKVHVLNIFAHVFTCLFCLAATFYAYRLILTNDSIINTILGILIAFCAIMMLINAFMPLIKTKYIFEENGIHLFWGRNEQFILYKNVMGIKPSKKVFTLYCLSIDKFEISFLNGGEKKKIYISPRAKEEFLKELKTKCKSMKIEK